MFLVCFLVEYSVYWVKMFCDEPVHNEGDNHTMKTDYYVVLHGNKNTGNVNSFGE